MKLGKGFWQFWEWLKQCPLFRKPSVIPVRQNSASNNVRRPMSEKELFDRTLNEQYGPEGDGPEWPQVRI